MKEDNIYLKRDLVLQSFAPLFLLLTIKHLDICLYWDLIHRIPDVFRQKGFMALWTIVNHPNFGGFFVSLLGMVWLVATILIALGFRGMQTSGFKSAGERIRVTEAQNDGSITFFVTYVLPLLTDNVDSLQDLIVFLLLLYMVVFLLVNAKSFYYNPILSVLKYKVITFEFVNPDSDIKHPENEHIGITRSCEINEDATIKRKQISNGVFLIYKD